MSEFQNRISAQRNILRIVNNIVWEEELFGLSNGAINRWIDQNQLSQNYQLVKLIKEAANQLFFLSNKSQEQITEDYKNLSNHVTMITDRIRQEILTYEVNKQ
ncbi:hypothetical protein [Acinetobacter vivianii]|uniref:hypothetical protein n=1 Tax=Acinetobacter vivianii TaxID=1776742 RepID=UPI002DB5718B|nr:hypothetical protein [Acinetobacter vivianii]MEB6480450.1 hypothetical protein [Acinetobacter vivianii]MEB6658897.1 hypothetical protein [Acinetobacter vivianii]